MTTATIHCRKKRYATRVKAQEALEAGREQKHYDQSCNVYLCLDCATFHIGHKRP